MPVQSRLHQELGPEQQAGQALAGDQGQHGRLELPSCQQILDRSLPRLLGQGEQLGGGRAGDLAQRSEEPVSQTLPRPRPVPGQEGVVCGGSKTGHALLLPARPRPALPDCHLL